MSLITALDLMESHCDLEETADDEPSLGCLDHLDQDNSDHEPDSEGAHAWGSRTSPIVAGKPMRTIGRTHGPALRKQLPSAPGRRSGDIPRP
ncbi:hypothetical protein [Mesorhizobium sophorae]|uniref:hypothetical protein n=1 Tax=Mesorhizobium sophorae TaxID=1300294 RepID=UPI000BA33044|nr:hypothetical protein [Mesorhizobium sophorae]